MIGKNGKKGRSSCFDVLQWDATEERIFKTVFLLFRIDIYTGIRCDFGYTLFVNSHD